MDMKFTWPDKSEASKGACVIVKKLRAAGHEALIAGGAVRDALLKRQIQDIDIATSAAPTQVKKLFSKTIPTGEKHGTITVRLNKMNYEVTTFRTESAYKRRRRPGSVEFITNPEKDAKRRDFTLNALFYDPVSFQIIDYVDGITDLRRGRIRTVGDPNARFREDALRLLRAVRFAAVLNLEIERETRIAIKKNSKLITKISAERIKQELDKIILSQRASAGIGMLDELALLQFILPELKANQGISQPRDVHAEGDAYAHAVLALELAPNDVDLAVRYAILFHDIGKSKTRAIKNGKATFYNHPEAGAEMVKNIAKRLKFSKAEEDKITWLVRYHMVPFDLPSMKLSTRRKWAMQPFFEDLLRLNTADCQAGLRPNGKGFDNSHLVKIATNALKEIQTHPELTTPILSGNEVMKILKIKPGPIVGKILRVLEEKKLENKIKTKKAAIDFLKRNKNKFLK